jgi:hypothetical protein
LIVLGLTLQLNTSKGIPSDSSSREIAGEIVLKHHSEQGEYYESQDSQSKSDQNSASPSLDSVLGSSAVQPTVPLPVGDIGPAKPGGGEAVGAKALVGGPAPKRSRGSGTKLAFMDIESEGHSFVFIIDRSASMSQSGRLAAAKAQLLAALKKLDKTNQFQIIFYNDKMEVFRPHGTRAFLADEPTKRLAERFVGGITADGSSEGFSRALITAVDYGPDVIYFLTDAEDIVLSDAQLAGLSRSNRGGTIHAIKFGEGAEERIPWMVKLAGHNGGKYLYVDTRGFDGR